MRNDNARAADQRELNERLVHLETNQQQLMETLSMCLWSITRRSDLLCCNASKERDGHYGLTRKRLHIGSSDEDHEHQFFTHTLRYLTTFSGRQIELQDWMITPYEVEFGHEINSGGLHVFVLLLQAPVAYLLIIFRSGQVFKGSWNKTKVVLKVFVMEDGVTPSSTVHLG